MLALGIAGLLIQFAIAMGLLTLIMPYLEGKSPGWADWMKGGLLILGAVVGGVALGLTAPEAIMAAGGFVIVAGLAYAVVEAMSAGSSFEEGVAADSREGMQASVKKSAREAEHVIPDALTSAIPAKLLKQLVGKLKPLKPSEGELPIFGEEATGRPVEETVAQETIDVEPKRNKGASVPQMDEIYLEQKRILKEVAEGKILLNSTARKGNVGEMGTDVDLVEIGWTPEQRRITDIDAPTQRGLDHVYSKPGPPKAYLILDSKFGTSKLSTLADGTRQMSETWIERRLTDAFGKNAAREIINSGYDAVVANVSASGEIRYSLLDKAGKITGKFKP